MRDYAKEIQRRIEKKKIQQKVRSIRMLSVLSLFLMVIAGAVLTKGTSIHGIGTEKTVLGALMLAPESGVYVLVGVLAFLIGICFAVVLSKYKEVKRMKEKMEDEEREIEIKED